MAAIRCLLLVYACKKARDAWEQPSRCKKTKEGAWVAPIIDWTKRDVNDYIAAHDLPRSPVVDTLHMSGECFCGAFARPDEMRDLRFWYPDHADYLERLEQLVVKSHELGVMTKDKKFCQWGHKDRRSDDQLGIVPAVSVLP